MGPFELFTASEQVANHLRRELIKRTWVGEMPGTPQIAKELGVNRKTAETALGKLEAEGFLISCGVGKRRQIHLPDGAAIAGKLSVSILLHNQDTRSEQFTINLERSLKEAGHIVNYAPENLEQLKMDPKKVAHMVKEVAADAWVIIAGDRVVLEWFAAQPIPCFAFLGQRKDLPIAGAGPAKLPTILAVVRRLVELGHRRIVMLDFALSQSVEPRFLTGKIFAELEALGIPTGSYNLPCIEANPESLYQCLDALFLVTPPTALMIETPTMLHATQLYLSQRGIFSPQHISLVCTNTVSEHDWFRPTIAHLDWDHRLVVRCALRWAEDISRGKKNHRQTLTKTRFVDGGTLAPVPRDGKS